MSKPKPYFVRDVDDGGHIACSRPKVRLYGTEQPLGDQMIGTRPYWVECVHCGARSANHASASGALMLWNQAWPRPGELSVPDERALAEDRIAAKLEDAWNSRSDEPSPSYFIGDVVKLVADEITKACFGVEINIESVMGEETTIAVTIPWHLVCKDEPTEKRST